MNNYKILLRNNMNPTNKILPKKWINFKSYWKRRFLQFKKKKGSEQNSVKKYGASTITHTKGKKIRWWQKSILITSNKLKRTCLILTKKSTKWLPRTQRDSDQMKKFQLCMTLSVCSIIHPNRSKAEREGQFKGLKI